MVNVAVLLDVGSISTVQFKVGALVVAVHPVERRLPILVVVFFGVDLLKDSVEDGVRHRRVVREDEAAHERGVLNREAAHGGWRRGGA